MKTFLFIILLMLPLTIYGEEPTLDECIVQAQQKRYIPPTTEKTDRSKITRLLSKYNRVGFQPVISILPKGAYLSVGPVTISSDRRYVKVGLTPFFSDIGRVDTFTFGR